VTGALALGCLVGVLAAGCTGGNSSAPSPAPSHSPSPNAGNYGTLPSWVKRAAAATDRTLIGTVAKPALTVEGENVDARFGSAAAQAMVYGPVVPGEGLPYQPEDTTCTWTVTVRATHGSVPIRVSDFVAQDHLGHLFHPFLLPGTRRPPATVAAGHTVRFKMRTSMPTGEGLLRWTPGTSGPVAEWDFVVEND
jgi:hypothetical protein